MAEQSAEGSGEPGLTLQGRRRELDIPFAVGPRGEFTVLTQPRKRKVHFDGVVLAATNTVVFTAAENMEDCSVIVANNDSSARTFQLHLVKSGDSADDGNLISTKGMTLTAGGAPANWYDFPLAEGDSIEGLCDSASKVSVSFEGRPA